MRDGIEELEVEMSVLEDVYWVLQSRCISIFYNWPDFDQLEHLLTNEIASVFITQEHLRVAGVPVKVSKQIFDLYSRMPCLHVDIVRQNPYRRWQEEGVLPDLPELAAGRDSSPYSSQRRVSNVIESTGMGSVMHVRSARPKAAVPSSDSDSGASTGMRRHRQYRKGSATSIVVDGCSNFHGRRSSYSQSSPDLSLDTRAGPASSPPHRGNSSLPLKIYPRPQIGSGKRFTPVNGLPFDGSFNQCQSSGSMGSTRRFLPADEFSSWAEQPLDVSPSDAVKKLPSDDSSAHLAPLKGEMSESELPVDRSYSVDFERTRSDKSGKWVVDSSQSRSRQSASTQAPSTVPLQMNLGLTHASAGADEDFV